MSHFVSRRYTRKPIATMRESWALAMRTNSDVALMAFNLVSGVIAPVRGNRIAAVPAAKFLRANARQALPVQPFSLQHPLAFSDCCCRLMPRITGRLTNRCMRWLCLRQAEGAFQCSEQYRFDTLDVRNLDEGNPPALDKLFRILQNRS